MNKALDGSKESRSGMCISVGLNLEERKTVLMFADGAENAQKSFVLQITKKFK